MAKEKDASTRRKQAGAAADARAEGRTDATLAQKVKSGPARRRGRRKRVRLGDAMRRVGLDERAIAENYAGVVEKLTNGQQQPNDGAEKLLVEVLKECTRVLEPPLRRGRRSGRASDRSPDTQRAAPSARSG